MKTKIGLLVLIVVFLGLFLGAKIYADDRFLVYKVDLKKQDLRLYWKNNKGENFGSIQNLKLWLEKNYFSVRQNTNSISNI